MLWFATICMRGAWMNVHHVSGPSGISVHGELHASSSVPEVRFQRNERSQSYTDIIVVGEYGGRQRAAPASTC